MLDASELGSIAVLGKQRSQLSTPRLKPAGFPYNMPAMEMRGFQLRAVPQADPSPSAE